MKENMAMALQECWMRLVGPEVTCDIIHPHSTCLYEIVIKCITVLKQSSRLYLVLYFTMFLVRLKKFLTEDRSKKKKYLRGFGKDFLGSLAFMSWLVGGMKTALCVLNYLSFPLDIRTMPFLSLVGSPSLSFLEKSRRGEVSYFVMVRACRSSYIFLKKRLNFPIDNERRLCFIFIFGIISYLYYEYPQNLKHQSILDSLWGVA